MIERDDELRKLLRQWEPPAPRPGLDARVWDSFHREQSPRGRWWLRIAAGVLLAAGSATLWMARPRSAGSIETRVHAAGFVPVADGQITIVKTGGNR